MFADCLSCKRHVIPPKFTQILPRTDHQKQIKAGSLIDEQIMVK